MVHARKILPMYYAAVDSGEKTFEIRDEDDTRFEPGDYLALNEWDDTTQRFTGRSRLFQINYVLRDGPGLLAGYVGLGLLPCVVGLAQPTSASCRRKEQAH